MKHILQQAMTMPPNERSHYLKEQQVNLQELSSQLGNVDSELRDELIFRIFVEALFEGRYGKEELQQLANDLITDNFLYFKIGESKNDTIYQRSFSALWLSYLLRYDNQNPFLSDETLERVFDKISSYLYFEMDTRGYVENEGWANAVAHGGELYHAAIQHRKFQMKYIPNILQSITKSLMRENVFIHDEEQMLAQCVVKMQTLGYPEEVVFEWIEQLTDQLNYKLYDEGYTSSYFSFRTNCIHLMQSLYFQLKFANIYPNVRAGCSFFVGKLMSGQ